MIIHPVQPSLAQRVQPRFGQEKQPEAKTEKSVFELTDREFYERYPHIYRGYHGDTPPEELSKPKEKFPLRTFLLSSALFGALAYGLHTLAALTGPQPSPRPQMTQMIPDAPSVSPAEEPVQVALQRAVPTDIPEWDNFDKQGALNWIKAQPPVFYTVDSRPGLNWMQVFSSIVELAVRKQPISVESVIEAAKIPSATNSQRDVRNYLSALERLGLIHTDGQRYDVYKLNFNVFGLPEIQEQIRTIQAAYTFPAWPDTQDEQARRIWFATTPVLWQNDSGEVGPATGTEVISRLNLYSFGYQVPSRLYHETFQAGSRPTDEVLEEMIRMGLVMPHQPSGVANLEPQLLITGDARTLLDQSQFLRSEQLVYTRPGTGYVSATGFDMLKWLSNGAMPLASFLEIPGDSLIEGDPSYKVIEMRSAGLVQITEGADPMISLRPAGHAWLDWYQQQAPSSRK